MSTSRLCLSVCQSFVAKRGKTSLFEIVTVEHVVGVEGDEALAVWVSDVDTGLFDATEVEGLGVNELDDKDAEEVVVAEVFGDEDLREAAEEFAEGAGLSLRGMVGREEFEDLAAEVGVLLDVGADGGILLVDDWCATAVDKYVERA